MELRYIFIPIGIILYIALWVFTIRSYYIGWKNRYEEDGILDVVFDKSYATIWAVIHLIIISALAGYYSMMGLGFVFEKIVNNW
jgi:hypothetical protein